MTKRKTEEHVIIKDNVIVCLHCGKESGLVFPMPVGAFVKQLRLFGRIHSLCKKELLPGKVYVMMTIGYQGAAPQSVFSFDACSDEDAKHKAQNWAIYQGFSSSDVATREAVGPELNWERHNEYVS